MAKKETVKKTAAKKKVSKKVATKKTTPEVENVVVEKEPNDDAELEKQVMKHVASEILVEKNNDINELSKMSKEEVVEKTKEKIEKIKKINNERVNTRIDNLFGYLWNGQEMDY